MNASNLVVGERREIEKPSSPAGRRHTKAKKGDNPTPARRPNISPWCVHRPLQPLRLHRASTTVRFVASAPPPVRMQQLIARPELSAWRVRQLLLCSAGFAQIQNSPSLPFLSHTLSLDRFGAYSLRNFRLLWMMRRLKSKEVAMSARSSRRSASTTTGPLSSARS